MYMNVRDGLSRRLVLDETERQSGGRRRHKVHATIRLGVSSKRLVYPCRLPVCALISSKRHHEFVSTGRLYNII